eukprot:scaffold2177_cov115-Cylindrotheca_fusiformis.AAC.7
MFPKRRLPSTIQDDYNQVGTWGDIQTHDSCVLQAAIMKVKVDKFRCCQMKRRYIVQTWPNCKK